MKKYLQRIELLLAQALILSASVLWYPIGAESGVKVHHIIIVMLTLLSLFSGGLIAFVYRNLKHQPILFFGLIGWLVTVLFTTLMFDTAWTPVKVTSFFLQVFIGNFAVYLVIEKRGLAGLKRVLNRSLIVFICTFFLLSGVPIFDVVEMFHRAVVTANPNVIIFEFLGRAPLFRSFSEDGLDGLRHTTSMYLVLVLLVNLLHIRSRGDVALVTALIFLLLMLQSRSAWMALFFAFLVIVATNLVMRRKKLTHWFVILVATPVVLVSIVNYLGSILLVRLTDVRSYSGRTERFAEAWNYFADLSFAPITMQRQFSSPHMFLFDTYYSGGLIAILFAGIIVACVLAASVPRRTIRYEPMHLAFVLAIPLLVRLFTAGSGLPGLGATLAFAVALALASAPRHQPERIR